LFLDPSVVKLIEQFLSSTGQHANPRVARSGGTGDEAFFLQQIKVRVKLVRSRPTFCANRATGSAGRKRMAESKANCCTVTP